MPSGPLPVGIFFVTCQVLRSITATWLSPFTATNGVTAGRRNQDAFRHLAQRQALDLLVRSRVEDDEIAGLEIRDQRELAVGRQLDPVRALGAGA